MKKAVIAIGLAWSVAAGVVRADEIIERVLAVAGGELITQSDVAAARELGLVAFTQQQAGVAQTREIVARLIDRALMLAEVDRYAPPEPSEEAVDREVQIVRARFASPEAFQSAIARAGLDDRYLREILRQNLRIRAYVDERFAVADDQRSTMVDDWVAGLRRRSTITELDPTAR